MQTINYFQCYSPKHILISS